MIPLKEISHTKRSFLTSPTRRPGVPLPVAKTWAWWPAAFSLYLQEYRVFGPLVRAAIRSDGHVSISKSLPNNLAALALFMLLFIALMPSFGSMYLQSGGVCQAGVEAGHVGNSAGENFAALQTPLDALYFSCVTMMTVGYGDYVPVTPCARRLVIWQLRTGPLLLLSAFPLLLSRMAAFPNDGQS